MEISEEQNLQEKCDLFVKREVYACQTLLICDLLKFGTFHFEDIENAYESVEDSEEEQPQEIFEWWIVSEPLADKLKELGEPILENDYGTWWGRTCTGQAIMLDSVIRKIVTKLWI